jgi:hypothetical protein
MDAITLLTTAFDSWLVERTGPNENSRTTQGVKLDVFATSMRDSKPIAANLRELAEGATTVTAPDVNQRITDLVGTSLVTRTDGGCSLTPLGRSVLERWRSLEVDTDATADELIRQTVLVDAGIRHGAHAYVAARDFWNECIELHPATSWFSNADAMYMVSYLNHTDSAGYNPWRVIQALRADVALVTGADWDTWAASTATPPGWSKTAGEKLVAAARSAASRYVGRVNFCMALEARRTALAGEDVTAAISEWNVPHA